ncbi:uncharacterized protein LOC113312711 [Papaver somniferum]|uniref:uncharacterized protein LOC113312711 n=1 Tax=Papaver somniferum TaxID=3469 RepID=UPI000E703A51|nr:uncharacterized protein LOC113312711 [Papaver somniferum]
MNNGYLLDIQSNLYCNLTKVESTHCRNERFGHINYRMLDKLINRELVKGVPKINTKAEGVCGASQKEPKNVEEALSEPSWVNSMHEELNQFKRQEVWELFPMPPGGFSRGGADKTLFTKWSGKNVLVAQIYVDDIIYGSTSKTLTDEFPNLMSEEFEMSNVGELSYFLGLQIQQQKNSILLSQEKYARNLVEKFELRDAKPMETSMLTTGKIQSNPGEKSVDQKLYRSMIGSLLYLTATRPDVAFSVGCCARFQADARESYLKVVKRIIRYVNC